MVYTMIIVNLIGSLFGVYVSADIIQAVLAVAVSCGILAIAKRCFTVKGVNINE